MYLYYMYTLQPSGSRFDWNDAKEADNLKKHGVSFAEATGAFFDRNAVRFFDPEHSEVEDRFILIGLTSAGRLLVVCHCYRENDQVIRLISARSADRREEQDYWEGKL